jgi:hypothetical protein
VGTKCFASQPCSHINLSSLPSVVHLIRLIYSDLGAKINASPQLHILSDKTFFQAFKYPEEREQT